MNNDTIAVDKKLANVDTNNAWNPSLITTLALLGAITWIVPSNIPTLPIAPKVVIPIVAIFFVFSDNIVNASCEYATASLVTILVPISDATRPTSFKGTPINNAIGVYTIPKIDCNDNCGLINPSVLLINSTNDKKKIKLTVIPITALKPAYA